MTVDDKITSALKVSSLGNLKLESPAMVESGLSVFDAVDKMGLNEYGCILVEKDSRLVGIFTERDVLMKIATLERHDESPVNDFMASDPVTLTIDSSIADAVNEMSSHGYRHIPVMDKNNEKCLGIITAKNIIDFVVEYLPEQVYNLPPLPNQSMLTPEGG